MQLLSGFINSVQWLIDREIIEPYEIVHCNSLKDIAMAQKALFNRTH